MSKKSKKKRSIGYGETYVDDYDDITKPNLRLKQLLLEVVDNQMRDNNPPVTKITYERLKAAGYTAQEAKEKIAAVLVGDIYEVMTTQTPHNEAEYERQLNELS